MNWRPMEYVAITSSTSQRIEALLAEPAGQSRAGGLVVLHEWWGLNPQIEDTCTRFAEQGLLVVAPDLYHGKRPETPQHASSLAVSLDRAKAMHEISAAVAFVRSHARCSGKVGVTGFCLGGAFAFECARLLDGIHAVVPFYGVPRRVATDAYASVRVPIQAHFARNDDWAKVSDGEEIERAIRAAGGQMELLVYDANHAFMRTTDKNVYHPACAELAWRRANEFLKIHLDGEGPAAPPA
jgi:carboxymethylenebutenolidase